MQNAEQVCCPARSYLVLLADNHTILLGQDRELMPYSRQQLAYYEKLHVDEYGEGDEGELTWFTAGVRVGVGLGLGLMLGVGIGIGLMVKTYHTTTRTLKRGLF